MSSDLIEKRPALTRDRIINAAIAMADADGTSGLTMRKLAAELGVEAMSLYNHVKNKAELLSGMLNTVAGEFSCPADGPWRAALLRRAHTALDVLNRHPWAAPMFLTNAEALPNMMVYIEATFECLVRAGFGYRDADYAWNAMDAFIFGFAIKEQAFPFDPETYAEVTRANIHLIPAEIFPNFRGLAEEVMSGRHDGIQHMDFGLTMILDGLERRLT